MTSIYQRTAGAKEEGAVLSYSTLKPRPPSPSNISKSNPALLSGRGNKLASYSPRTSRSQQWGCTYALTHNAGGKGLGAGQPESSPVVRW